MAIFFYLVGKNLLILFDGQCLLCKSCLAVKMLRLNLPPGDPRLGWRFRKLKFLLVWFALLTSPFSGAPHVSHCVVAAHRADNADSAAPHSTPLRATTPASNCITGFKLHSRFVCSRNASVSIQLCTGVCSVCIAAYIPVTHYQKIRKNGGF